ncbi:MAG: DUF1566 domain-containing protein [Desulfobacterales bacterium]|nr:DUF1566 domain-containing protein [Desulfobacterales bacterium]
MKTTNAIQRQVFLGVVLVCVALFLVYPGGLPAANGKAVETSNQARFADNGDGTVLDRQTGLMWLRNGQSTLGAIPWVEAGAFCNGLKFAGYSDWRLPTKDEMATIVDTNNQSPALPLTSPFENVVTFLDYWTQTDHTYGPGYAWALNLYYGKKKFLGKKKYAFAWPVRRMSVVLNVSEKSLPEDTGKGNWLSLDTKYARVHYLEPANLQVLGGVLDPTGVHSDVAVAMIGPRLDSLYLEVQALLDMRIKPGRFSLTVYPDRRQMKAALKQTLGEEEPRLAWYNPKKRAIFISADELSENILAHEMALAVIYQYMQVPPPRTTVKILAGYVDSQRKSLRSRLPLANAGAGVPAKAKAAVLDMTASPMTPTAPSPADTIAAKVQSWQAAWQNKQLEAYITHYHPEFVGSGRTLSTWKAHKARLNKKYQRITITITELKTNITGSRAFAWFKQQYTSDVYHSKGYKMLEFKKIEGEWKIFRETPSSAKPDNWPATTG